MVTKKLLVKDFFDRVLSLAALVFLFPVFLFVSAAIKFDSRGGPIFFVQERVGKNGKLFKVIKFRTMRVGSEEKTRGKYVKGDDPNITSFGRILRRTGIDELPQLINVLRGEMSLVGPRPTLKYQVDKYDEFQKKRLLVKPGITGWALVNGRNKLTWPERIKLDVWYVEHWSLWLDFKILLKTLWVVARGEGLYSERETDDIARLE